MHPQQPLEHVKKNNLLNSHAKTVTTNHASTLYTVPSYGKNERYP